MKTIGSVLQDYRQKRHLSVGELSRRTAVPAYFIEALEAEEREKLPALSLVKGYIRLIAAEIDLPEESALALFRRDLKVKPESLTTPRHRRGWRLTLTPRFLSLSVLWLAVLIGCVWLFLHWRQLGQPPELEVTTPQNYDIVSSPVTVTGTADAEASLTINTEVISLDPQGRFSFQLDLPPGERAIVVQATDRQGRQSEAVLFVTVE